MSTATRAVAEGLILSLDLRASTMSERSTISIPPIFTLLFRIEIRRKKNRFQFRQPSGPFTFQKLDGIRHTLLWWDAYERMDSVWHSVPLNDFKSMLPTHCPDNLSNPTSHLAVYHLWFMFG
jgi:hypothetical protein